MGSAVAAPVAGAVGLRAGDGRGLISLRDRGAWRDAALVWLGQHALLLAAAYLAGTLLRSPLGGSGGAVSWGTLLSGWLGWDGANYAVIAAQGYHSLWMAAFFPALPAVERALAPLAGGNPAVAGMLAANAAELGAFGLFRVLAERELGREPARRALLYLALFPTAFFFAAPYTESLFLLLSVGAFLALRRGRWLVAGTLAALATLTRSPGILLLLPLAAQCLLALRDRGVWSFERGAGWRVAWRRLRPREGLAMAAGLLLPCTAFAGYTAYLHAQLGRWDALAYAQAHGGGRGLDWPWVGFLRVVRAFVEAGPDPSRVQAHMLLDVAFTLAFIALAVVAWRRLPLPYALYAGACLAQALCTPAHNWYALSSNMRYMLAAFPLFFVLGQWGERRGMDRALLWTMPLLLALFTAVFVLKGWVA